MRLSRVAVRSLTFGVVWSVLWITGSIVGAQSAPGGPSLGNQVPSGRRLALVVGNDAYKLAPLGNARNDARAVSRALETLGFQVTRVEDTSRQALVTALAQFGDRLQPEDLALFYYAGHGVQLDGENYLIPVDFDAQSPTAVRLNGLRASEIQDLLERGRVAVLILDACRTNPFAGTRGSSGLTAMEPRGSLIAFATGAGQTAADSAGATNSVFTTALLEVLTQPGLSLREMFYQVRQRVYSTTRGQQFPAVYDGLLGDLILTPAAAPAAATDLALRAEMVLWESIRESQDSAAFQDYLRQFPAGRFRAAAEAALRKLNVELGAAGTPASLAPPPNPTPGSRWNSARDGAESVSIPAGTFQKGSPPSEVGRESDERQSVEVLRDGFWLDVTEVTQRAYAKFLADRPEWSRDRIPIYLHDGNYLQDWPGGSPPPAGKERHPVVNVSWYAAQAYCEWAGKRLPTEVEWEYAARAGAATSYWWGDNFDATRANNGNNPLEVGAPSRTNPWGLADMLGNVWEWTGEKGGLPRTAGPAVRVTKGGSWSGNARFLRAANRNQTPPVTTSELLGFRCAL